MESCNKYLQDDSLIGIFPNLLRYNQYKLSECYNEKYYDLITNFFGIYH